MPTLRAFFKISNMTEGHQNVETSCLVSCEGFYTRANLPSSCFFVCKYLFVPIWPPNNMFVPISIYIFVNCRFGVDYHQPCHYFFKPVSFLKPKFMRGHQRYIVHRGKSGTRLARPARLFLGGAEVAISTTLNEKSYCHRVPQIAFLDVVLIF